MQCTQLQWPCADGQWAFTQNKGGSMNISITSINSPSRSRLAGVGIPSASLEVRIHKREAKGRKDGSGTRPRCDGKGFVHKRLCAFRAEASTQGGEHEVGARRTIAGALGLLSTDTTSHRRLRILK
eukprot:1161009-Pelagomonas_calceolata.AAC.1